VNGESGSEALGENCESTKAKASSSSKWLARVLVHVALVAIRTLSRGLEGDLAVVGRYGNGQGVSAWLL
jgi:hypothetical protein